MTRARMVILTATLLLAPCPAWGQSSPYWNNGIECTPARREVPRTPVGTTMPEPIELKSPHVPDGLPKGQEQSTTFSFVVDADGRVEPCTIQILKETDRRWTAASVQALAMARFKPAATGSQPIRLSIQHRFVTPP